MAYKLVPNEEAHKLTREQMIGRRVVLCERHHASFKHLVGVIGVVKEIVGNNIDVHWPDGSHNTGSWQSGDGSSKFNFDFDLVDDSTEAPVNFMPEEDAKKLTAKQIVGMRVMSKAEESFGVGTVRRVAPDYEKDDDVVEILWDGDDQPKLCLWGYKGDYPLKLIIEESMTRTIMPREKAHTLKTKDELVGRRVCRGRDWNPTEDEFDGNGKFCGTITNLSFGGDVVYVKWDGDGETKQHYWGSSDGKVYEVDIVLGESKPAPTPQNFEQIRPYDPNSAWERPNVLVMAMFSAEFTEARKTT